MIRKHRKRSRAPATEKPKRSSWVIAFGLMLIPLALLASAHLVSGVASSKLERRMAHWSWPDRPPGVELWESAEGLLKLAERLTPSDAWLLEQGAELYLWRSRISPQTSSQWLEQAIEYQRKTLRARPGWPYSWSDLAQLKAEAGQFDAEFQHALKTAMAQGPWENEVQLTLTDIALNRWRHLSAANRNLLRQNMENAIAVQPHRFFQLVERRQRLPMICYMLEENPAVLEHCQKKFLL